ncbi:MAG: S8 family serine peptidase, partial [Magnetococcus sp. WYHC-3]
MKRYGIVGVGLAVAVAGAVGVALWTMPRETSSENAAKSPEAAVAKTGAESAANQAAAVAQAPVVAAAAVTPVEAPASTGSMQSESSLSPAPAAPANPAAPTRAGPEVADEVSAAPAPDELPGVKGEMKDIRESPADANGRFTRISLLRSEEFKYPWILVEEQVQGEQGGVQARQIEIVANGRPMPGKTEGKVVARQEAVADHVLVRLAQGKTEADLLASCEQAGLTIRRKMHTDGLYLVTARDTGAEPTVDTLAKLQAQTQQALGGVVARVERDRIAHATALPNDPDFGKLWGMQNTGQNLSDAPRDPKTGTPGCDIKALAAWDISTGSRNVLVAVIDTGIDYTHEDLAANMWINPGETGRDANGKDKQTNGLDDDGNGFIDDWHGWDFSNDDNDCMDDHYHGTHCAGTIGGVGNNGVGVAGVCWNVSLVGLKFLDKSGSGAFSDAIDAINYAMKIGAKVLSNSWGGSAGPEYKSDPTDEMRLAINAAGAQGIVFVAAAGNAGSDNDGSGTHYPSSYDCANIISVAATDSRDQLAFFSCYGLTTVDIGAPGLNVWSCKPRNSYQYLAGTSMATPHVAGACALALSVAPYASAEGLKAMIMACAEPVPALAGKCVTGGRLDLLRLVKQGGVFVSRVVLDDDAAGGTSGNGDGIVSPGETIGLTLTLMNMSTGTLSGVVGALSASNPNVTVTQGAVSYGDIAPGASAVGNAQCLVQISASTPTPQAVDLLLTVSVSGKTYPQKVPITVYTSSRITGRVTRDGVGVANATVGWLNMYLPWLRGELKTGADGNYSLVALDGAHVLRAWLGTNANGFASSAPVTVTTPPNRTGVDFAFTSASVAGRVTDKRTGAAVAGARVTYAGREIGTVFTDSLGAYRLSAAFSRPDTLMLRADKPGAYDESDQAWVTLPPSSNNVNFAMTYGDIEVNTQPLDVTAAMGSTATRTVRIQNRGSGRLEWSMFMQNITPLINACKTVRAIRIPWNQEINTQGGSFEIGNLGGIATDGEGVWLNRIGCLDCYTTSKDTTQYE